ncbi:MAG: glycoside hydrolase family 2 protein, partial [Parabacteroides sp.]|nr:glycoside hydrolase family 2 protein [Parabacteroides sp.]
MLLWTGMVWGQKEVEKIDLDKNWYFTQAGIENWATAEVPGTVQQDLLRHGKIPEPYYGMNEKEIQWIEDEDWEYKTAFTVTAEQLKRDAAVLVFEGLDTYADVYLNGALLVKADNMFVGHKVPVKQMLREGENRLHIYFHSPIRQTLPQWRSNGYNYPASNDHREEHVSVFTRKTPCSYGWDWGIRMVTSGIWRPVYLCFQDVVAIEDCYVRQMEISPSLAKLQVELELENLVQASRQVTVSVSCDFPGKEKQQVEKQVVLNPNITQVTLPIEIENPELWMPNGWGKPNLYHFDVVLKDNESVVAHKKQRVGLRTIEVKKEKDQKGESFYFVVNGIPMFAKGANYIPSDAMLPSVTPERYHTLFEDVKDAHMNMIRVWGGGIYENDLFYDLADEYGILIWQDFMFACAPYPHDPMFLKRVEPEVKYNIRRLRNHACLAMWCGNNEIFEALRFWSWKKRLPAYAYEEKKVGYEVIFNKFLPDLVEKWDGDHFYIHSSPYFSRWDQPETLGIGDCHNWGVWSGKQPFESFDQVIPRFMSEFGFQAFPEMKTIRTFADSTQFHIESPVMKVHQKSSAGNGLIHTYMERDYVVPEKFEDFVYVGMVMQGVGMRRAFDAHRRNKPYCMGTLYWQLNDNWPVVSWSGRDYYGNWKALYYQ